MTSDHALTPDLLLQAYRIGVFPMSESRHSDDVFWVDPKLRGILPLDGFHISRSLRRTLLRGTYRVSVDTAFDAVVTGCADREETWINGTIFDLYTQLFARGTAHSVEVWQGTSLVGGVYGVAIGAAFFGESMFSRADNASKVALAYLTDRLARCGFQLFDTQFITPHLATLGGVEIPRAQYQRLLREAVAASADFNGLAQAPTAQDVVQRNAQTS